MKIRLLPALLAGLVGGVGMTAAGLAVGAFAPALTMDVARMWAVMGGVPRERARVAGLVFHLLVSATIGLAYARVFAALRLRSDLGFAGLAAALPHWALAGLFISFSPPLSAEGGPTLPRPGPFARNLGSREVVGFLFGHLLYGLIVGLAYEQLLKQDTSI